MRLGEGVEIVSAATVAHEDETEEASVAVDNSETPVENNGETGENTAEAVDNSVDNV